MLFLWTATGFFALFLTFGISMEYQGGRIFGLTWTLVAWVLQGLLIWFDFNRATKREAEHAAMLNEAGDQP